MKNTFKKIISLTLAIFMVLSAFPITAFAASSDYSYAELFTKDNVKYIEIFAYNGKETEITIPSEINGCVVAGVNMRKAAKANSFILSEGIEYVAGFQNISNLSIQLPSTLKSINDYAFNHDTIEYINLPEGLEGIGVNVFCGTSFAETSITLPESLKYIDTDIFTNSNITELHIGSNVKIAVPYYQYGVGFSPICYEYTDACVSNGFFSGCTELKAITVDEENEIFSSVDSILFSKDKTGIITYPAGKTAEHFVIPKDVTCIGSSAFAYADIQEITISNNVEKILENAFYNAGIKAIHFEENCSLKALNSNSFCKSSFTDIIIPSSIEEIASYAFYDSNISSIAFEENSNCKTIEKYAFSSCKNLKSIKIPCGVTTLESNAFKNCTQLETVIFEDNSRLTSWNADLFSGCTALKNFDTGKNNLVYEINNTFSDSGIEYLDLSRCTNLNVIKNEAFKNNANLKSINLSNTNIKEISTSAFRDCKNLESVILPETTEKINSRAFENCVSLANINLDNVYIIEKDAFTNCPKLEIKISSAVKGTYGAFDYYEFEDYISIAGFNGEENTNIVIPSYIHSKPVTKIKANAFSKKKLTGVQLPEKLESIGENAFYSCNLTSISEFPNTLTDIGMQAFYNNPNLTGELAIPQSVHSIYSNAFYNCGFTAITLSEGLTYIGANAFHKNRITEIVIPDSISFIGKNAFNSETLKRINFGSNSNIENFIENNFVENVVENKITKPVNVYPAEFIVSNDNPDYSAVNGVLYSKDKTKLVFYPKGKPDTVFTVPDTVTEIGTNAFKNMAFTEQVILPDTLKKLNDKAFSNANSLKRIELPGSITDMGEYAFAYCGNLTDVEFETGFHIQFMDAVFFHCSALKNVVFQENVVLDSLVCTFEECTSLESMDLNCHSTYLSGTFYKSGLKNITLPEETILLEDGVFYGTAIESITIPKNVTKINGQVFADCTNLKYINLSNVKSLNGYVFEGCTELESIDLTGVIYVDSNAFINCPKLKKFYFTKEELDTYIAENEFQGNEAIETIVIGSSINEIKDSAFADCTNLETALISPSVTNISDTAFDNCSNLEIVCMEGSYAHEYAAGKSIPYTTFVVTPIADQLYTGNEITPSLDVTAQNEKLKENTDYTAVFDNNINVGTANVNVIGLGDYRIFSSLVKFNIIPNPDMSNPPQNQNDKDNKGNSNDSDKSNQNSSTPPKTDSTEKPGGSSSNHTDNENSSAASQPNTPSGDSGNKGTSSSSAQTAGSSNGSDQKQQTEENKEASVNDQNTTAKDENHSETDKQKTPEHVDKTFWHKIEDMFISFFAFLKNLFSKH